MSMNFVPEPNGPQIQRINGQDFALIVYHDGKTVTRYPLENLPSLKADYRFLSQAEIDAAPQMFEALEKCLANLETLKELSALHLNELPEPLALDLARAALKLAGGGE